MVFLEAIQGIKHQVPPVWMMRQAGRYLPGYRSLRAQYKSFLSLCLSPQAASEVTLEPIHYFDFDAAIVFADILMVPFGFGQALAFEEGRGPVLGPLSERVLPFDLSRLDPVMETLRLTRKSLSAEKALIGFAGSPWTVLSYMVEGGSSKTFEKLKAFVYSARSFDAWMISLIEATVAYLLAQIKAGADVVMLFDSWAGQIPYDLINPCCLEPHAAIIKILRQKVPHVPIITFPRHLNLPALLRFVEKVAPDVLAVSNLYDPQEYVDCLPPTLPLQLGPDPVLLKLGGDKLKERINYIHKVLKERPYIMNLSHGVLPQTPLENVHDFIKWVRYS